MKDSAFENSQFECDDKNMYDTEKCTEIRKKTTAFAEGIIKAMIIGMENKWPLPSRNAQKG